MSPSLDENDSWCACVTEHMDIFFKKLDEKIDREQQQLKARRKRNELECKLAQELKLNAELKQQLAEISRRDCELERACSKFKTCLNIADSDRNRLDNAKETYEVAKELTGVRFDYSAPSDLVRGYIKNERRRLLQPFEEPAEPEPTEALWARVGAAAEPAWPRADKENSPDNKI